MRGKGEAYGSKCRLASVMGRYRTRSVAACAHAARAATHRFGCLGMGRHSLLGILYDQKKDDELQEVFDYAVSKGVTFFDTTVTP